MRTISTELANPTPTVALVVTSCGRADLLLRTLESFAQHNTYPLHQAIIVEDGGLDHDRDLLASILNVSPEDLLVLKNQRNIGQIKSIDRAYAAVNSQYIFHCEDDWEFYRSGFVENSLEILLSDPRLFCVWIRAHNDTNGHPVESGVQLTARGHIYYLMENEYRGVWSGFTFNPGLRRTSDCLKLGPYSELPIAHAIKGRTKVTESDLSIHYYNSGFRAAICSETNGYVRHIGDAQHLANEWESALFVMVRNTVRRLIHIARGKFRGV